MEISLLPLGRPQAAPFETQAARDDRNAASGRRVAPAPTSDLANPFNPGREMASAIKSEIETRTPDQSDSKAGAADLSDEDRAIVAQLAARDREVRNHEEAHARVGGPYAGAPSYSYQTGPDGKRYAIGGEVAIDVSPVADDPEATIDKMEIVKAAALAPAEPSGQDRRVAAVADAQRQQAIADLAELRRQTEPVPEPMMDIAA